MNTNDEFYFGLGKEIEQREASKIPIAGEGAVEFLSIAGSTARFIALRTGFFRSEEHTSELQSQSTISYAVFCLKKKNKKKKKNKNKQKKDKKKIKKKLHMKRPIDVYKRLTYDYHY